MSVDADCRAETIHANASTMQLNAVSMRWLNASDTGDATQALGSLENSSSTSTTMHLSRPTAGQDHFHDCTLSPAKQRAVVGQQVERHAFQTTGRNPLSRLLAHDPILTLTCIFAPTNDRDHMVNATYSGGNASRFPVQQRHSIDATSNWTELINSQHPERQTPRERNPSRPSVLPKVRAQNAHWTPVSVVEEGKRILMARLHTSSELLLADAAVVSAVFHTTCNAKLGVASRLARATDPVEHHHRDVYHSA